MSVEQTSDLSLPARFTNGATPNGTAVAVTNGNTALESQKETVTTGGVSGIVPTLQ
jgi:hypothetical protein